jgi:hypothetical protein
MFRHATILTTQIASRGTTTTRKSVGKRYAVGITATRVMVDCSSSCVYTCKANNGKVDALYECCNAFYKEKGDDARCVSCPKPDLLRYTIIC